VETVWVRMSLRAAESVRGDAAWVDSGYVLCSHCDTIVLDEESNYQPDAEYEPVVCVNCNPNKEER